ncbi:MAG TPA: sulfate ABC transporter ATP-binding protein [Candidatus Hydrogenedentes bacterium]|jgi:sulfate transport system ATP-binding protein|nr:sulfate ABC transporter ATP-binding protein [Candidatus Hydrogenedentota bacterium]HOD94485.1 sulfate ABC transporter ATP-binding protein [Candidatus Hydrogenedentota bacterium]HOM48239.1 sulfate ABC transporter ATP-binding protein [Candidatus Hydrogenedentota bacterium]HOR49861.1 sulfate ABC transporter ATP-binding protein [Candidatus Hydrogenedentota bacterium]HPK23966.1 sulfate ABC transporter ATP-binding protein [Candidatus Hydrogenedentota bacterium]
MSIEVQHISKSFGSFHALKDVSLRVKSGELMALLGPSGSGKTSLLRIISGLDRPDVNPLAKVIMNNEDMISTSAGNRRVGFVFQHYALFRHMTVFDNIAFGMRMRRKKERPSKAEIKNKVEQLLHLIQLDNMGNRYPLQLSGGQRQRVALARALAIEPKVLLLDEPFGALDARVREDLRRWLRRLHKEIQITTLFVTHDQEEALELADRVVVMNEGRIEQIGTPEEVFHSPRTEFVMKFLGSVNLFHGRIERGKAVFGSWKVSGPEAGKEEGTPARLFVRPYDMTIVREGDPAHGSNAVIRRIQSAGPYVKIELEHESGENIIAEMSHERHESLKPLVGEKVAVSLKNVRVFTEDYTI